MDRCSGGSVYRGCSYGQYMSARKQKKTPQDKTAKKRVKKVTTGAWWKSGVEEETSSPAAAEQQPQKKRGRPPKKVNVEKPSESLVKPETSPSTGRQWAQVDKVSKADGPVDQQHVENQAAAEPSAGEQKKSAPPAKKPGRRGRPRKKQPQQDAQAKDQLADVPLAESTGQTDSQHADGAGEAATPPARSKRGPRPKRSGSSRGRKPSPQKSQDTSQQTSAGEAGGEEQTGDAGSTAALEETVAAAETLPAKGTEVENLEVAAELQEESAQVAEQEEEDQPQEQQGPRPVIKLLINAEEPEECRLALLEDGRLESIHVATSTRTQTKNNIYKARIVAIEPNLQAAFVDYGTEKNGFLPFSEIHPEYYKENVSDKVQKLIDGQQWKKLSIIDVVEKGREVLVQVVKEEVGRKGANMTTYLSLPGRCVVLMPGSDSTGISRKISGEEQRSKLRNHIQSMNIPEGIGWIVRTASVDITKAALGRDVNYLLRLWEEVKKKGQDLNGVGLVYQDHDHVLRFLREHFDPDIQEILVDDKDALEQVKGFVELLPAKQRNVKCKLHRGARPIFNQYSIEDQIESIYQPKVNLPSGGSIVIDPTEALVAIDVNSGSTSKGQNFEETIFQANLEAARELARQLRLRDLGGLIVVDFIDMRTKRNIREVEREIKQAMKRDKAKVDISRISKFGLMQISRQKLGAPIEAGNYRICGNCKGRGIVRSVETQALYYLRRIHTAASRKMVYQIECRFPLDVAGYLLNNKRHELRELELKYNTEVVIIADPSLKPSDHDIIYHKTEKDAANKKRS